MVYQRVNVKQIIRQRCDLENTTFETDVELDRLINDCASVLHDLLISCGGSNYAIETNSIVTTAGVANYTVSALALGVPPANRIVGFYIPVRVSVKYDSIDYPLSRFEREGIIMNGASSSWGPGFLPRYSLDLGSDSLWRITFDPAPDSAVNVYFTYHTTPPEYGTDADLVVIPFLDYLIVEACIRVKDKEDRDTLRLERERAAIQKRIEDWGAKFDQANPARTIEAPSRYQLYSYSRSRAF